MPTIQIIGVGPFDMFRSSKRRQPEQVQVCPGLRYKDHQAKAEGLCVALLSLTKPWEHDGWAARQGVFKSMSVPCLWLEVLDRLWPAHSQRWCRLIANRDSGKLVSVQGGECLHWENSGKVLSSFSSLGSPPFTGNTLTSLQKLILTLTSGTAQEVLLQNFCWASKSLKVTYSRNYVSPFKNITEGQIFCSRSQLSYTAGRQCPSLQFPCI